MGKQKGALWLGALIIIVTIGVWFYVNRGSSLVSSQNDLTYVDPFGYSFEYPRGFEVSTSMADLARFNAPDLTPPEGSAMEAVAAIRVKAEAPKAHAVITSSSKKDYLAYISDEATSTVEDNGGERSGNQYYSVVNGKLYQRHYGGQDMTPLNPAFTTESGLFVYKDDQGYIVQLDPNHFVVFNQAYFSPELVPLIKSLKAK